MLQQRSSSPAGPQAAVAIQVGTMVEFDPAAATRGIVFHLLDERLAKRVADDTVQKTVERLTLKALRPAISRSAWGVMTNPQRLQWLLAETQTITVVGADDIVSLRARRSR